jgi:hypothetical protein
MSDYKPEKFAKRLLAAAPKTPLKQRWRCFDVIFDRDFLGTGLWHLSVSEAMPVPRVDEDALRELVVELGVPKRLQEGEVLCHQARDGKTLPDVRHWFWPIQT